MRGYYGFKPYVPVAQRRAKAEREMAKRTQKGQVVSPVVINGRAIATTFWGKSWCENLEGYADYENRIPRGRTYVRNGSVVDLSIKKGAIDAVVSGSEIYTIHINITELPTKKWEGIKSRCAGKVGTLVELLQGKLSAAVMEQVTNRETGLFPNPAEIKMRCSCPDSAGMCKHLAAAMYGVGNRLDSSPELLFVLRGVDHLELIDQVVQAPKGKTKSKTPAIADTDLGAIFDIDLGDEPPAKNKSTRTTNSTGKPSVAGKKPTTAKKVPATKMPATKKPTTAKKTESTTRVKPVKSVSRRNRKPKPK